MQHGKNLFIKKNKGKFENSDMENKNAVEFDKSETDDVVFPSGKLSYVIRIIHDIEGLMLDNTLYDNDNYSNLRNKEVELDFRYEILYNACLE